MFYQEPPALRQRLYQATFHELLALRCGELQGTWSMMSLSCITETPMSLSSRPKQ